MKVTTCIKNGMAAYSYNYRKQFICDPYSGVVRLILLCDC